MDVSKKIVIVTFTMFALLTVFLIVASHTILLSSFSDLEARDTIKNTGKIEQAIAWEALSIDRTARDWAYWDDTYHFVNTLSPEYIESNLDENTLYDLDLNIMLFVNKSVRVVGVLEEKGMGDDSNIYIPIDGALNLITDAKKDVYDTITVKAKSEDLVDSLMDDIVQKLMVSRHIIQEDDRDFSVTASKSMAESVTEMMSSMTLFLGAIAAVSLLVGSVGIANTMFTSVLEKTKEIGTMKAIGAKNRDILMIFLFNSAMVGFVGGILGIMLGWIVSYGLQSMMGNDMTSGGGVSISLMIEGLALAVIIGVISGVVPAYRASKLKPVDALRYE